MIKRGVLLLLGLLLAGVAVAVPAKMVSDTFVSVTSTTTQKAALQAKENAELQDEEREENLEFKDSAADDVHRELDIAEVNDKLGEEDRVNVNQVTREINKEEADVTPDKDGEKEEERKEAKEEGKEKEDVEPQEEAGTENKGAEDEQGTSAGSGAADRKESAELKKQGEEAAAQSSAAAQSAAAASTGAASPESQQPIVEAPRDAPEGTPDQETKPDPMLIPPNCEVCRKLVRAHSTVDPSKPKRLFKPCRAVAPEMRPACEAWEGDDGELLATEVSPSRICLAAGHCTAAMNKFLDDAEAEDAKAARGQNFIQSGSLLLDQDMDIMREMFQGSGPRRVDHRVEFATPYEAPPRVHLALSRLSSPKGTDLRARIVSVDVDRYGFDIDILTWFESKLEMIGVDWIAYSRAYTTRGEIRSGAITLTKPTTRRRKVYFPGTFAIAPHVVIGITAMDSANNRNTHFEVNALDVDREGFTLDVRTFDDSLVRSASLSWLAFQNSTKMFAGTLRLSSKTDVDFKEFYTPPLGDRAVERSVIFVPEIEGACEDPTVRIQAEEAEERKAAAAEGAGRTTLAQLDATITDKIESASKGKVAAATNGRAKVTVRSSVKAEAAPVVPVSVAYGSATKLRIPAALPGSRVAFVLESDPGCFEAARSSAPVDGLHETSFPEGGPKHTIGQFKVCLGPGTATKDSDYSVEQGAFIVVVRSVIDEIVPVLDPMPPNTPAPLRVVGNGIRQGDFVSLVPIATVGCEGAREGAGIVTPEMRVAQERPAGDYKVCHATPDAKSSSAFVEQWAKGRQLRVHVGGGTAAAPKLPETSLRNAILNDSPAAYWQLADASGAEHAADAGPGKHDASVSGAVEFGDASIAQGEPHAVALRGGHLEAEAPAKFGGSKFSIEAWFSPSTVDAPFQGLVSRASAQGGFSLYLRKDTVVCETTSPAGVVSQAESQARVTRGKSFTALCTYGAERLVLYVNGFETARTPSVEVPGDGEGKVLIGLYHDAADQGKAYPFLGRLSNVALYAGQILGGVRAYRHFSVGFPVDGSMAKCAATENRPPLFTNPPNVRTHLSGFDFERDASLHVRSSALRSSEAGFTLEVSTWGTSRMKDLLITWIAHDQPPSPPRIVPTPRDASDEPVGTSCLDILNRKRDRGNGIYSLALLSGKIVKVYCDMDDGGWTRVVNISPKSSFHGDNTDESNVVEIANEKRPAKLPDADINRINTVGYFRFKCGANYDVYVKNENNLWTSKLSNDEDWSISRKRDPSSFSCKANKAPYVFSEVDDQDCKKGYAMYAAPSDVGRGCFHDGLNEGWGQEGSLWSK